MNENHEHSGVSFTLITDSPADNLQLVNKSIVCELDCCCVYDVNQAERLLREAGVTDVMLILTSEWLILVELRLEIQQNILNIRHIVHIQLICSINVVVYYFISILHVA